MKSHKWVNLKFTKKMEFAALFLLLAGGIFIRAFHFGIVPVGVHQDEAMAAVDALALADHGTDRFGMRFPVHFTAWGNSQMSVLLSYCMIPFIKLFGFSIPVIRLPLLIVSCFGLLALYFFARKIGGTTLAFPVLILCIICPWHYMQSRWSFDCHMFPHVFLFGVCMLLTGIKKRWALYLSMIFFGLCSYCYGIANYTVPLFLLIMAIYLLAVKQVKWQELLLCVLLYFTIALPEFLTMLINMFGWDSIETPLFTIPYFPDSTRSQDILFINFSWSALKNNLSNVLRILCGMSKDLSATSIIPKFGNLYPFTTIFFFIGLVTIFFRLKREKETEKKISYVAVLLWLVMAIWAGINTVGIASHRFTIFFYPMIVISGMGIQWCIYKCRLSVIPIAGAYGVAAILFITTYYGEYEDVSRIYYYEPYLNALYYAAEFDCDSYYIAPDPQGTGEQQVAEILTVFCHEIDAEYLQGVTDLQNGKKVLPFRERYLFETVTSDILHQNRGKNIVYLVARGDVALFSPEEYNITSFYDSYYVVVEKGNL